jgi:nicotinate-nucleotide adenylyltransferase
LAQRPSKQVQSKLSEQLTAFLKGHYTENADDLADKPAGYVHMQHITAQEIAATSIREKLVAGENVKYLVPDQVLAYIQQQQLYK